MTAGGLAEMLGMSIDEIEYSAEVALEHHLGLTCDPIGGLVQIPCIERNAVAAMRAINAVNLAGFLTDSGKISLDMVLQTMYETGKDMQTRYKETSKGGLAKHYKNAKKAQFFAKNLKFKKSEKFSLFCFVLYFFILLNFVF